MQSMIGRYPLTNVLLGLTPSMMVFLVRLKKRIGERECFLIPFLARGAKFRELKIFWFFFRFRQDCFFC